MLLLTMNLFVVAVLQALQQMQDLSTCALKRKKPVATAENLFRLTKIVPATHKKLLASVMVLNTFQPVVVRLPVVVAAIVDVSVMHI